MASPPRSCATTTCCNPLEERRALLQAAAVADRQGLAHGASSSSSEQPKEPLAARDAELRAFQRAARRGRRATSPPLCQGLAKLVVVDIALSRDQDNPQLIFESMNSTGRS